MYKSVYELLEKDLKISLINKIDLSMKVIFKKEEAIYSKFNYPEIETHIKLHNELIRSIISLKNQIKTGDIIIDDIATFLKLWISNHESTIDSKANAYIGIERFIIRHAK